MKAKLLITCLIAGGLLALMSGCADMKGWRKGEADWMRVQIPESYNYDKAFAAVLDVLSDNYEMGLVNKEERYITTSWSFYRKSNGKFDKRTRTRITIKFSHDGKQLSIKTEVQRQPLFKHHWIDGHNDAISSQMRDDLQNALR